MTKKYWMGMGLAAALWGASPAMGQLPPATPASAPPAAAAPGAAAPADAAAAAGAVKLGFFEKCCAALDRCRRKCCKTPLGQMLNAMTAPAAAFSGGVIPSFCPITPSLADLAQPGVAGAADMAKKDALEAKARREAVKYLGTLDCRYYPEAEAALIAALRADRVECVRLEAAISFANGCCCTKRVLEALEICVSGSERDGNPAERSERVRDIAFIALNRCVACYREPPVEVIDENLKLEPKEIPAPLEPKELIRPNITKAEKELIERARKTVALYQARRDSATSTAAVPQTTIPKGQRSLFNIIKYGAEGSPATEQPVMRPASRIVNPPAAPVMGRRRELPQVKVVPAVEDTRPMDQTKVMPVAEEARPLEQTKVMPVAEESRTAFVKPPLTNEVAAGELKLETPTAEPMASPNMPTQAVQPMMSEAAKPKTADEIVSGLIDGLLTGATPNERHQAILSLSEQDWKKSPQVVAGLVKTARVDSDRSVRVNAIRHLASMKMDVQYVYDHLKYMQKDQDEWVAQEATFALEKLQTAK